MQNYIDLSKLEKPKIIEELSVEAVFGEAMAGFKQHIQDSDNEQIYDALLASDPAVKLIEYFAYREFLLRQRINDAFAETLLAYASGKSLDHKAAAWNTSRGILEYDKDGNPIKLQSDDDLRTIIQLAPESITTAGSRMSYIFHALNMGRVTKHIDVEKSQSDKIVITYHLNEDDDEKLKAVRDVNAFRPQAGHVHIAALSYQEDGALSNDELEQLNEHLNDEYIRPLTDYVTVMQGINKNYHIKAEIKFMDGVDKALIMSEAQKNINEFIKQRYQLGETASIAGIYDAIHTANVRSVKLIEPASDVVCAWNEAPKCINIELMEVV